MGWFSRDARVDAMVASAREIAAAQQAEAEGWTAERTAAWQQAREATNAAWRKAGDADLLEDLLNDEPGAPVRSSWWGW